MEAIEATALHRVHDCREVEAAYREQAARAVDRYNTEYARDPHSAAADSAWKLRKEALSQWAKARQDLAAARQDWKLQVSMAAARRRALVAL